MMKKTHLIKIIFLIFFAFAIFISCEESEDIIEEVTMGTIRDEDDAHEVAVELNDILENIRNNLDYGYTYTDYSPDGTYSVTGSAYSGPIFSGSYTTEYIKKFTVTFNNYTSNDGMEIESGSIRYEFTDYSTSGYHLIIKVNSTSGIYITYQIDDYTIEDIITNLTMGDIDDNKYKIGANFRSSNGNYYDVNAY